MPDEVDPTLATAETDNTFYVGQPLSGLYRDRWNYDRQYVFRECLRAWRVNPVARRIVKLITQFVVGKEGFALECEHRATQKFLNEWVNHPLNFLDRGTLKEWSDEQFRTGNLFFLFSVVDRMPFVRAVPADLVLEINAAPNDYKQELSYAPVEPGAPEWPAWTHTWVPAGTPVMLHHGVNRPVGCTWGEPDMAPMLDWIGHFSSWLRDRARLNRFRNVFNYIVIGSYKDENERRAREIQLNANPPQAGSILVVNKNSEQWGVLSPQLDAFDASNDGLALKRMVALAVGFPMHYLAEPESSTRTTAEAAGTPTFRNLEDVQTDLLTVYARLARAAVFTARNAGYSRLDPLAKIKALGPDISERDNTTLALAVARIYPALSDLFDRQGIDEDELLRLVYRMAGEVRDQGETAPIMLRKPIAVVEPVETPPASPPPDSTQNPTQDPAETPSQEPSNG